ncbi:hypothetical protein OIU76_011654 [Salix suchowensis]|nr:hypothetical protein OIU76_011654 [Salix suchowensis]KAJ6356812.1 hypothetical protein OIU78_004832 [Salix suchowensis]
MMFAILSPSKEIEKYSYFLACRLMEYKASDNCRDKESLVTRISEQKRRLLFYSVSRKSDEDGILNSGLKQNSDMGPLDRFSLTSEIVEGNGLLGSLDNVPLRYTLLLQAQGDTRNEEIVRGKAVWKKKQSNIELSNMPFSI